MTEKDEKVHQLSSVRRESNAAEKQIYEATLRNEKVSKSEVTHQTSGDIVGDDKEVS
jgi:hypothetical protein